LIACATAANFAAGNWRIMRRFISSARAAIAIAGCDAGEPVPHVTLSIDPPLRNQTDAVPAADAEPPFVELAGISP
jgi:hypothetical protein